MRAQPVHRRIARRHAQPVHRTLWLRWVLVVIVLLSLMGTGAAAAAGYYFVSQLPPVSSFHARVGFQDAHIYDSQGRLLYDMADLARRTAGYRVVEPLQHRGDHASACAGGTNRIPLTLQNATIATEDATFYKNPGFDPLSIVRAAYQDLRYGHIVSGASTITQQVVRDFYLHNARRTVTRKLKEIVLSYEITRRVSKRHILWIYLNGINYGNLAYGAPAAAHVYFNRPVCSLDLAQSALLAGLPRAPSLYDPLTHRAIAMVRLRMVLHLMRQHGYIRPSQIRSALREAQRWRFSLPARTMRYPGFVRYVIAQLQHTPQLRADLYKGIDVYTTLDSHLQDTAQSIVTAQINRLTAQHVTDGALVSLDLRPSHYGWILAMVGSAHSTGPASQVNMAVRPRQPGSSMKPFNYIWAFTHAGLAPGTMVQDSPIRLPDPGDTEDGGWYTPTDYDHQFHGTVTVRQALANSLNLPAVKVEYYLTGPQNVARTAYQFGMTSLYHDNPNIGCSLCWSTTLGGLAQGARPLQETAAYGVFATGGRTVPPVAIWKVVKRETGQLLYCSSNCPSGTKPTPWLAPRSQQVVDPAHAYLITSILSDNGARCTIQVCEFGLTSPLLLDHPAAAKTGTTNNWTDNWTVGYTPQIITGVWVGNADRTPMVNVIGITGAAPIWHDFMEGAFRILRLPSVPFVAPPAVVTSAQCHNPGSSYLSLGTSDVQIAGSPPLCSVPDLGYMPESCTLDPTGQPLVCSTATPYQVIQPPASSSQSLPGQSTYPQQPSQPAVPPPPASGSP
ncbi:MAG TPA: transglycosylase domain-containing protein [Chloroflexota bacterium]|nr:transglycosylase domain-containing protein [Chloroflexota bacterium]